MAQQTVSFASLSTPGSQPFYVVVAGLGGPQFDDVEGFRVWAKEPTQDPMVMAKMLACWYLGLDPTLANPSILLNASITYDDVEGGFVIQVGA